MGPKSWTTSLVHGEPKDYGRLPHPPGSLGCAGTVTRDWPSYGRSGAIAEILGAPVEIDHCIAWRIFIKLGATVKL